MRCKLTAPKTNANNFWAERRALSSFPAPSPARPRGRTLGGLQPPQRLGHPSPCKAKPVSTSKSSWRGLGEGPQPPKMGDFLS